MVGRGGAVRTPAVGCKVTTYSIGRPIRVTHWLGAIALGLMWPVPAGAQSALDHAPSAASETTPFLSRHRTEIEQRVRAHRGVVGLTVLDPTTGERFEINGDEQFPSASMVKVAVLVDVFERVKDGTLKLVDPLSVLNIDRTAGSGVLQYLSLPKEITVWDAAYLMIAVSDNVATNVLLEKLSPRAVTARMESYGFHHTRIFAKVNADASESFDPDSSRAYGLGVTTPNEMAELFAMLYRGEAVEPDASAQMLAMLSRQYYLIGIQRFLPPEVPVAHKTGSLERARNDCGIVYGPKRHFVICLLTKENADASWTYGNEAEMLISDVARLVYEEWHR